MNYDEIVREITTYEQSRLNSANLTILASLYVVRDNLSKDRKESVKTLKNDVKTHIDGDSDFIKMCNDVDIQKLFELLDEHMNALKVIYPKEYTTLMGRIGELRSAK